MSFKRRPPSAGAEGKGSPGGEIDPRFKDREKLVDVPGMPANPINVEELICWDFDILKYHRQTNTAFKDVCFTLIKALGVIDTLGIDDITILKWLEAVEHTYENENPYHNCIHAADVLQALSVFLEAPRLKNTLTANDRASLVIAAIVHDIHHPGLVNASVKRLGHPLIILGIDPLLEYHHVRVTFKLLSDYEDCNIFKNLDAETYEWFKAEIKEVILATDMDHHQKYEDEFITAVRKATRQRKPLDVQAFVKKKKNLAILKKIVLKAADISSSQRLLEIHLDWAEKICEEFFRQTSVELEAHLVPTLPAFTRNECIVPETQVMFYQFIRPLVIAWSKFIQMEELQKNFEDNDEFWRNLGKENLTFDQIREIASDSKNEV